MNSHLNEDDLVLHYYGEMDAAEETRAATHLRSCDRCSAAYRHLQSVLAMVDERTLAVPALPDHFERTVWARLEPELRDTRTGRLRWFTFSPARLAWVATVVMLVGAAFVAGRFMPAAPAPESEGADRDAGVRERILLVDLGDHLDRSQMVLVELLSADADGPVDISGERERAEQLLAANRLYRHTAVETGDAAIADLLDSLERLLVDIAASPDELTPDDLDDVRRRIESQGLLFKVRVLSSEVRRRQRPDAAPAPTGRSTL